MAQQQKLADLIIEFSLKGVEVLKAGLANVQQAMTKLNQVAEVLTRKMMTGFTAAAAAMAGYITAGVRASYLSDLWSISMDRLARTLAGLVKPELLKLLAAIDQFTAWIHRLVPAQKEVLATWIEMAVVGKAVALIFGGWVGVLSAIVIGGGQGSEVMGQFAETGKKLMATMEKLQPTIEALAEVVASVLNVALDTLNALIDNNAIKWIAAALAGLAFANIASTVVTAIATIISALKALTLAKITALAFSGPSGWAQIAAGVAIAGAAVAGAGLVFNSFSKATDQASKKHKGLREEVAKRSTGFEGLEKTYERIAAASVNVGIKAEGATGGMPGKPAEEVANDWLQQIAANTGGTKKAVENQQGAFVG